MKTRMTILTAVTTLLVTTATLLSWRWGRHQGFELGYAQGARDEFQRWKLDPVTLGPAWDGFIIGRRDSRSHASPIINVTRSGLGAQNGMTLPPISVPIPKQ